MAHTHTDSGSGTASGMILGIVLVLLVLVVAAFVFFGGAFRPATSSPAEPSRGSDTNIQVNPPAAPNVDVKVESPGGQAPSSGGSQQAPSKP
jgi:hypothetical protein